MQLELPDIGALKYDDPNYAPFLDDSLEKLYAMYMAREKQMRTIANVSLHPAHCKQWFWGACPHLSETMGKLNREMSQIKAKSVEFIGAALKLVDIKTVYEPPHPSQYAQIFYTGNDGTFFNVEVDLYQRIFAVPVRSAMFSSREELESEEGIEKIIQECGGKSVHIISTPLKMIPPNQLISYAASMIQEIVGEKYPDFAEKIQPRETEQISHDLFSLVSTLKKVLIYLNQIAKASYVKRNRRIYGGINKPVSSGDPRLN